jgi:hypothetical protein
MEPGTAGIRHWRGDFDMGGPGGYHPSSITGACGCASGRRHEEESMNTKVAAAAVLVLASALPALAGFRIQEVDPEFPDDLTTTWFQGGKARVDGALEGLSVIVDVKGGEGWLIDTTAKRYAGGKIADLAEELRKAEGIQVDAVPPEDAGQRGGAAGRAKPHAVQVKDLGAGERIQGYDTQRYQVLVDGELLEELWLAPKLEIAREIDLVAFMAGLQKMLGGGAGLNQGYEDSPEYRKLRATGYPLRQVLYFVGEKSTLEVKSVSTQEFPASDFAVPKGFSKVGFVDLLFGEGE